MMTYFIITQDDKTKSIEEEEVDGKVFYDKFEEMIEMSSKESYDDYLDEIYGPFEIAKEEFLASRILKELDPDFYTQLLKEYTSHQSDELNSDLEYYDEIDIYFKDKKVTFRKVNEE